MHDVGLVRGRRHVEGDGLAFPRGVEDADDFDAGVVEAGAAGDVGERVGDERIGRRSVDGAPRPQALRQRNGAGDGRILSSHQTHRHRRQTGVQNPAVGQHSDRRGGAEDRSAQVGIAGHAIP